MLPRLTRYAGRGRQRRSRPQARVKRASPESLPANAQSTRVIALPCLKRPKDAGFRADVADEQRLWTFGRHRRSARRAAAALCQPFNSCGYRSNTTHSRRRAQRAMQAEASSDGAGPSPRETGISGGPARKRPIHAGFSDALSETPKRRGLPGRRCGRTATVDVRTPQTFCPPRSRRALPALQ